MEDTYKKLMKLYFENDTETFIKSAENIPIPEYRPKSHDGLVFYPSISDPAFNKKIANKKEFIINNNTVKECSNEKFELTENQQFIKNFLSPNTNYNSLLLYHGVGVGKCHAKDTPILMFDGTWKLVQHIKIGDQLMGDDSKPRNVISLGNGIDHMYKITFNNKESFVVNSEHILCLKKKDSEQILEIPVKDFIGNFKDKDKNDWYLYTVPIKSFKYSHINDDKELISIAFSEGQNTLLQNKRISKVFLYAAFEIRELFFNGMLSVWKKTFLAKQKLSLPVIKDIKFISQSLGHHIEYEDDSLIEIIESHNNLLSFSIDYVGKDEYFGFTLDSNHRYVIDNFIVTHNTCTAISTAEQYHSIYNKRILVILSSNLIDNFKKQIFDINKYDAKKHSSSLCTGTSYPDLVFENDPVILEKQINKIINERYEFIGYKELAILMEKIKNKIAKTEKDPEKLEKKYTDSLSNMFSNRLIIIDEAHNLRNPSETGKKQISVAFKTLMQKVKNVKLILLTATPMFNDVKEIIWTLNLLLINSKKPELKTSDLFDSNNEITQKGIKKIIESFRGIVSYMRGENPYTFPYRLFPSINNDKNLITSFPTKDIADKTIKPIQYLEIVGSLMSEKQKKVYNTLLKEDSKDSKDFKMDIDIEDIDADNEGNNSLQKLTQIANIVYPNDSFGNSGFSQIFDFNKNKYSYNKRIRDEFGEILSPEYIQEYSPKIKTIIDYVKSSEGIVFIYSRYYSSGIVPLAIALEHEGYTKYGGKNITKDINVSKTSKGSKGNYVIISTKAELSPDNIGEIAAINNVNNLDGSKIKIVIVSKIGSEGIDFKGIREVHILEPWYNLNKIEQIVGRGVRFCSHMNLPKEKRNVTIYFHAICHSFNKKEKETVDLRIYRLAEIKQKKIAYVEKLLKENSIDCALNEQNLSFPKDKINVSHDVITSQKNTVKDFHVGDTDYSYLCGFDKCDNIKCAHSKKPDDIVDESTYDTYFIKQKMNKYKQDISNIFSNFKKLTFHSIRKKINNVDSKVLALTLYDMINTHYLVNDKSGYLIYRSKYFIFQPVNMLDKRMTMKKRLNSNNNRPLFISIVPNKETIPDDGKDGKDGKSKSPNTKETLEIQKDRTDSKDSRDSRDSILQHLQKIFDEKKEVITQYTKMKAYDKVLYQWIIDNLDEKQFLDISYHLIRKNNKTAFEQNIYDNMNSYVIFDNAFVYNYFQNDMFMIKDDKLQKCNPLDVPKYQHLLNKIEKKKLQSDTIAYSTLQKTNQHKEPIIVFKLRDDSQNSGYICHQTSHLTLTNLKDRLKDIILDTNKLPAKKILCFIYDIYLRKTKDDKYQRPQFFILKK